MSVTGPDNDDERPADLDRLVAAYLPEVRRFVRMRVGPELRAREAESDIVQSICRELVEDFGAVAERTDDAFRAWLFTAALNKIRQKARFHGRARRAPGAEREASASQLADADPSPSAEAAGRETAERLEQIMDRMPEDYRTVIALCRIARLPHAIVAEQMGRSVGAVRQLLGRALLQLAAELKQLESGSDR